MIIDLSTKCLVFLDTETIRRNTQCEPLPVHRQPVQSMNRMTHIFFYKVPFHTLDIPSDRLRYMEILFNRDSNFYQMIFQRSVGCYILTSDDSDHFVT